MAWKALHPPLSSRAGRDPVRRGSRFNHQRLWDTGSPAGACHRAAIRPTRWRVTTTECGSAFSRHDVSEVCLNSYALLDSEGAGNAGCALHPRSHVQWVEECAHEHTGQRRQSDIPCAMALRLYNALSPVSHILLPPSTPTMGRQDHTSLPYAPAPFAIGTTSVHRDRPHVHGDHEAPL